MIKEIKNGRLTYGDCLKELRKYPSDSIDLIMTDPPYGLSYYCLDWDKKVPGLAVWQECLRVLKPGAFIFVMSAVRQDVLSRMIVNLTDAGFNTQFTSLYWTYTSGFPKASNITNAIDKKSGGNAELSTGLRGSYAGFQPKPAVEAILVAMKPLTENCYVDQAIANQKGITFLDDAKIPFIDKQGQLQKRFMSNLVVSDNALDPMLNGIECTDNTGNSFRFSLDAWAMHVLPYLMVSKPSQIEKDLGLDELPDDKIVCRDPGQRSFNVPMKHRPSDRKNIHPTVKPLKLMAYLTVLGSRPGDIVLDPYCGSGTSCVAAKLLGRKFIGMEIDKQYYEIAKARLTNISKVIQPVEVIKTENIRRLSEVESIELRWEDGVIDMKSVPDAINHALDNLMEQTRYENFEIKTIFKPEDSTPPVKEKDNVQDWADKGINISKGCSNNCRYCYAREESVRRHGNVYENWTSEQLNQKMIKKGWRLTTKKLMFPTTHDITPGTYDACESVLKKLLKAGNEVLVVSKPRFDLIEKLCDALEPYKARVMFRFTISARNNEILSFWEPNAPSYEDRVDALIIAHSKGFRTSVSIEPMLDPTDIKGLVEDLRPYTSDSMWIGPVKMIRKRTRIDSQEIELEVQKIEAGQTPEKLLEVYNLYKDDPLIKWKGHFRKLLRKIGIEVPEQNDNWRDKI
jgi:site-specific DNA-methyltransferase (adenine-specific)